MTGLRLSPFSNFSFDLPFGNQLDCLENMDPNSGLGQAASLMVKSPRTDNPNLKRLVFGMVNTTVYVLGYCRQQIDRVGNFTR